MRIFALSNIRIRMTEEQLNAKKRYAGDKKASMKRRDDYHDYAGRRMYMITVETEWRQPLFGHLAGDAFAAAGSADAPRMVLSELGEAVQSEWMGIHSHYPQIDVLAVQMMPDHMHGILFVKSRLPVHLGQVISGFKAGCRRAERALAGASARAGASAAAEPQPTEKAGAAAAQAVGAGAEQPAGGARSLQATALPSQVPPSQAPPSQAPQPQAYRPIFAKGYNDLILRSYDELARWQNYLHDNPRRLLMKRARPEWLRPFFGLRIGSHTYSGIGNRELLNAPRRMAVRLSRRLTDQDVERELKRYITEAEKGTVLVSPAISPGEKKVMRAAFNKSCPTIVIMENGFTALSKPKGEQFYACASGQLLMLSAWEHHNDHCKVTAEQCQLMNMMALEICEQ